MGHIKFGAKTETNNKKRSRDDNEEQVEEQTTKKQRLTVDTSVASTTVTSSASTPVPATPATDKFDDLDIVDELKKAIKDEYNFEKMTGIQLQSVPAALANRDADIIAQARTGSGKTIAFLLPAIDYICRNGFANGKKGIGALVLAPTRELALQIKTVAEKLLKNKNMKKYNLKLACVIGGSDKYAEAKELANASLLIATPGRCLDHLNNTDFTYKFMKYLILDEADQLLDIGFERDIKLIGIKLPKERSTYLFSATLSTKVEDLVAVSMKKDALKIGFSDATNVNTLEQKYVQVPADKKMAALVAILKENSDKKIIVFVAVKKAVNFVSQLLTILGMNNTALHGDMTQEKRSKTFFEFMNDKNPSILIATDVAARGLDFPCVDLIVQVDLPEQFAQYFHRVGRTARAGRKGTALLLLTPLEISVTLARIKMYLEQSAQGKSDSTEEKKEEMIEEYKIVTSESEMANLHQQVVDSVASDNELYYLAPQVVNTYSGVFDMFARKLGFGRNQFDRPGLESSFGMNGGGKKGGFNKGFSGGNKWGGNKGDYSGGKSWENKGSNNYGNKSSFGGKKTKF